MDLPNLRKRVRALEAIVFRTSANKDCTCRSGRKTYYHTAADLEQIMSVRCSAHGFRDQGDLLWVPPGTPLLPEDRHLCSCPSCPTRDLLAGQSWPSDEEEQQRVWQLGTRIDRRREGKTPIERAREEATIAAGIF